MHPRLAELAPFVGKATEGTVGRRGPSKFVVFDWGAIAARRRAAFLDQLFGDLDDPKAYAGVVARGERGVQWVSVRFVPFALAEVDAGDGRTKFSGGDDPQFSRLLLADVSMSAVAIHGIEVDGTAVPAKAPRKLASKLAALSLRAAPKAKRKRVDAPGAADSTRGDIIAFQTALFMSSMSKTAVAEKRVQAALRRFEEAFAGSIHASAPMTRSLANDFRSMFEKVRAAPGAYRRMIPRFSRILARFPECR